MTNYYYQFHKFNINYAGGLSLTPTPHRRTSFCTLSPLNPSLCSLEYRILSSCSSFCAIRTSSLTDCTCTASSFRFMLSTLCLLSISPFFQAYPRFSHTFLPILPLLLSLQPKLKRFSPLHCSTVILFLLFFRTDFLDFLFRLVPQFLNDHKFKNFWTSSLHS